MDRNIPLTDGRKRRSVRTRKAILDSRNTRKTCVLYTSPHLNKVNIALY